MPNKPITKKSMVIATLFSITITLDSLTCLSVISWQEHVPEYPVSASRTYLQ